MEFCIVRKMLNLFLMCLHEGCPRGLTGFLFIGLEGVY